MKNKKKEYKNHKKESWKIKVYHSDIQKSYGITKQINQENISRFWNCRYYIRRGG